MDLGPTQNMSIKQVTWEGRDTVATVRNDEIHKWLLATKDLDPGAGPIMSLTASLAALFADGQ